MHLNFQFREPLAPSRAPWQPDAFLRGLQAWLSTAEPYTAAVLQPGGAPAPAVAPASAGGATPEMASVLQLLLSARRGLVVVGEQLDSSAAAASLQLGALLGFPVAADVLSGLRVGTCSSSSGSTSAPLHHFDHILLPPPGSTSGSSSDGWWRQLQPDVILQLGPRVTSKRVNQFLEWSALGCSSSNDGGSSSSNGGQQQQQQCTPWLFVGPGPQRHDAAHLVTAHVAMTPQQLLAAVAAARQQQSSGAPSAYARLLAALDAAAAAQLDASLSQLQQMSEMAVARVLAHHFPPGCGLFLGNSMPIRDMDMYSGPRQQQQQQPGPTASLAAPDVPVVTITAAAAAAGQQQEQPAGSGSNGAAEDALLSSSSNVAAGEPATIGTLPSGGLLTWRSSSSSSSPGGASAAATAAAAAAAGASGSISAALPAALVGVPVGANRGASGIDGVLSSAAGFAAGLRRPVTLVIGDLSFLHDVNGLSLLRGGEMAPPLTVVLVNNRCVYFELA